MQLRKNFGFVRVASAVPEMKVADCEFNTEKIIEIMGNCYSNDVDVVVFPELCVTGYTCGDLFQQKTLLNAALDNVDKIVQASMNCYNMITIVGAPIEKYNSVYNMAIVIQNGMILGFIPKKHIPNYKEFYEQRWFTPGDENAFDRIIFRDRNYPDFTFGIEICEDVWVPNPPSVDMSMAGASIIFNLSASNEIAGKYEYRKNLITGQSARCMGAYVYSSCGINESTSDLVFSGHAMIAENGSLLVESPRFSFNSQILIQDVDVQKLMNDRKKTNTFGKNLNYKVIEFNTYRVKEENNTLYREINPLPFVPKNDERLAEIFNIQAYALAKRLKHISLKNVVIGISGGLDSTLALLVTVKAFDILNYNRKGILGITMPGFGTTDETYNNAMYLMESLGITIEEIRIRDACKQHFEDIGHDINNHNLVYENAQARERTQILMDKGFVIGTGDLSELALGWCTYNGDHMSMYSVNCSIPKTLVKHLVKYIAEKESSTATRKVLKAILETEISPELLPPGENGEIVQKTEDTIGPYELHDFFLYNMIRNGFEPHKILYLALIAFKDKYDILTIKKWLKGFYTRFFNNQFKRNCVPDGPKVGTVSLSPRGDWRMPSDAMGNLWIKDIEKWSE